MVNQLQQAPHGYHPTAPEAFDGWTNPGAWAFVEAFPSAADLVRAGKRKWDKFPHGHKLFRAQTYPERIAAFQRADQWQAGAPIVAAKSLLAVARRRQLRVLQGQIEACRQRGAALFASHPGSGMFGSLPAAGPKIAPRLLGGIGSDRALHQDPKGLQCMAGTAPVSYQSGKARNARIRRGRNKHLRHAMCLFAGKSRAQCAWAARYCETHRARGRAMPGPSAASASAGPGSSGRCGSRAARPTIRRCISKTSSSPAPGPCRSTPDEPASRQANKSTQKPLYNRWNSSAPFSFQRFSFCFPPFPLAGAAACR